MPTTYNQNIRVPNRKIGDLSRELMGEIDTALKAKKDLDDKIGHWNDQYEGVLPAKDDPWPGCANLHVPLTAWQIDTCKSQLVRTICGTKPIWRVEGEEAGDQSPAHNWELWLDYLADRHLGIEGIIAELCLGVLKHGTAIAKLIWDRREDRLRSLSGGEVIEKTVQAAGPRLTYVPLRHFVLVPAEARTIRDAVAVGDRKYLRLAEIQRRESLGIYREGTAKKVAGAAGSEEGTSEIDEQVGIDRDRGDADQLKKYETWEMIWSLPLREEAEGAVYDDKRGVETDCLVSLIRVADKPVIARLIRYPWFHNRRHYIGFRVLPREGMFWGRSAVGILSDIQDELNTEHNQRVDLRSLGLQPPIKVQRSANITDAHGRSWIRFRPGEPVVVGDMAEAEWWQPPDAPQSSFQEEAGLVDYAERIFGVSEQKVGRTEAGRKTLGEVEIVEAQGNVRFDDMVNTVQGVTDFEGGWGLREVAYQLMGLTVQFEDDEKVFRVLSKEGDLRFEKLRKPESIEEAIGAYDYIPQGNTMTSNRVRQRQEAGMLYEALMQNPLVINDPRRVWQITRKLLLAHDQKDWRSLIGSEEEAQKMAEEAARAAQEAAQGQGGGQQGPAPGGP